MFRALLVAQREYLENIRTKGFWFGIMMMPIMLLLISIVPVLVESTRSTQAFTVVDESAWLLPEALGWIEKKDLVAYLEAPVDSDLKTPLDSLKRELVNQSDEQVEAVAGYLMGQPETVDQLPLEIRGPIISRAEDIRRWWQALSETERGKLSPRISSNHFRYEPAAGRTTSELNDAVRNGELFAYIVLGKDPVTSSEGFRFVSNNLTDRELLNWFSRATTSIVRQKRLTREGIDAKISSWINEPVEFEGRQISDTGEEEKVDSEDVVRQWTPVVFVYLLWISVLINTQMLLTNTIEEKSNKLIEVLLSSISPIVLMAGKILGIAATGLTIIAAWIGMASVFFLVIPGLIGLDLPFDIASVAADPWFLGSFIVYFLLGYLLYAAILVGLGSVCNNLKEAQNLMLPVQLVQMLPILLMVPIGRDPNGTLAQILSYVPPLTPFVMMNRAAGPPSTMEYVVTTALLVISIVAALWVAAKIFRIGILLTGKPPGILEILRWLKAPVTQPAVNQP